MSSNPSPLYALGSKRWRLGEPCARLAQAVDASASSLTLDTEWTWETPWVAIEWHRLELELVKLCGLPDGFTVPVLRAVDGPPLCHDVGAKLYPAWPDPSA